jgi:hypothetical protein
MMFILAKRAVKAIHNSNHVLINNLVPVDATRFAAYFGKLFGMMIRLEESKYQPPKLSDALWELADAMGIRVNLAIHFRIWTIFFPTINLK